MSSATYAQRNLSFLIYIMVGPSAGYHSWWWIGDVPPDTEASLDISRYSFIPYLTNKQSLSSSGGNIRTWRQWTGGIIHGHKISKSSVMALTHGESEKPFKGSHHHHLIGSNVKCMVPG